MCGIAVARDAHALVFGANVQRGSRDFAGDTERTKARKDAGVEALLFDDYPIRHWDHYLGPAAAPAVCGDRARGRGADRRAARPRRGRHRLHVRRVGRGHQPGRLVRRRRPAGLRMASPRRTTTSSATTSRAARPPSSRMPTPRTSHPMISPDGRWVAAARFTFATPDEAERMTLVLLDATTGEQRQLAADADRRPDSIVWGPDASTLYFTADDEGNHSRVPRRPPGRHRDAAHRGRRGDATSARRRTARPCSRSSRRTPTRRASCGSMPGPRTRSRTTSRTASTSTGSSRPASSSGSARPPRTGRRSAAGSSARRPRRPRTPRRSSCSCTAGRSARGTCGTGAGTRTSSSSAATRSSSPTPRCRPATASRCSTAAGGSGAARRTPTSWP